MRRREELVQIRETVWASTIKTCFAVVFVSALLATAWPAELGAQIVEEITIEGGVPPTRTGGREVKIEFQSPDVCFTTYVGRKREVAFHDCLPVCNSAGRRVYMEHNGRTIELGYLNEDGILIVDPTTLASQSSSAVRFTYRKKGHNILIDISKHESSTATPFSDLALSSEVDVKGCRFSPDQWGFGKMSSEDTLKLIRERQKAIERDPSGAQKVWKELERRHGKKYQF